VSAVFEHSHPYVAGIVTSGGLSAGDVCLNRACCDKSTKLFTDAKHTLGLISAMKPRPQPVQVWLGPLSARLMSTRLGQELLFKICQLFFQRRKDERTCDIDSYHDDC